MIYLWCLCLGQACVIACLWTSQRTLRFETRAIERRLDQQTKERSLVLREAWRISKRLPPLYLN